MWTNQKGEFVRDEVNFRQWIRSDGSTPFLPEKGRYHLYLSLACPWASRTLFVRNLRKLEGYFSISVVDPVWNENGWCFTDRIGCIPDTVNGKRDLIEIYKKADPSFSGEETVPVLWDRKTSMIVNNESLDIIRMMDVEFASLGDVSVNFYPKDLAARIDETIQKLYSPVNNGVYRCGFAKSQSAYDSAVRELFGALDHWDQLLGKQRYLCGDRVTEADVNFFTTLVRFDSVYHGHFKCNIRRITDYPNLWPYLRDLYQLPGVAETVNMDHIKEHYYRCHDWINPTRVVPAGPELDFLQAHGRERLSRVA